MLKKIRQFIKDAQEAQKLRETTQALVEENKRLKSAIHGWKNRLKSPKEVIKAVIGRETKWIDYDAMDYSNQKKWFNATEAMKRNPSFKSLFGYENEDGERVNGKMVKNFIEMGIVGAENGQQTRDMQMSINGIEYVWEELSEITDPDINKKDSDSHIEE